MAYQLLILMAPQAGGNPLTQMLPLVLIIIVFYFFMIRPQMKKAKDQKKFVENLQKGDKILTIGGIYGKVVEVRETGTILIETEDGSKMLVAKSAVTADGSDNAQK